MEEAIQADLSGKKKSGHLYLKPGAISLALFLIEVSFYWLAGSLAMGNNDDGDLNGH